MCIRDRYEALLYLSRFKFTSEHLKYIQAVMPYAEPEFFAYLEAMDMGSVKIHAVREGKFIFPKEPALTLEGPLGAVQIIESTIINLTSYPTLVCTNAVRMRVAAGRKTKMIEFGLRRGQGPVGATMGAKYAIMGTFEGTANTLLGFLSKGEIPITGTMAHSYVISFTNESDLGELRKLKGIDLVDRANHYRNELNVSFCLMTMNSGRTRTIPNCWRFSITPVAMWKDILLWSIATTLLNQE
eukprot:TRINITY_DN1851_c0_g1_i4.p1 TRINITY_DN1851_c0_g1~~TRINITY_DN1851_c0_g1_i4.p1  ORF type:complete len:242 (+),score=62.03 TRINITY_DN1851_c0_g1_i4:77-802(+)